MIKLEERVCRRLMFYFIILFKHVYLLNQFIVIFVTHWITSHKWDLLFSFFLWKLERIRYYRNGILMKMSNRLIMVSNWKRTKFASGDAWLRFFIQLSLTCRIFFVARMFQKTQHTKERLITITLPHKIKNFIVNTQCITFSTLNKRRKTKLVSLKYLKVFFTPWALIKTKLCIV